MSRTSIGWILALALAACVTASLSAVALGHAGTRTAHGGARTAISVTGGSGHVSVKAHGPPELTAHFTVRHAVGGGKAAKAVLRFQARLELIASGHTVVLERFAPRKLKAGRHLGLTARVALPKNLAKRDWKIVACVSGAGGCRRLGSYDTAAPKLVPITTTDTTTSAPTTTTTTTTSTTTTAAPPPQVPVHPLTGYTTNAPYFVSDGRGQYENQPNASGATPSSYGGFFTSATTPSYRRHTTPRTARPRRSWCGCTAVRGPLTGTLRR